VIRVAFVLAALSLLAFPIIGEAQPAVAVALTISTQDSGQGDAAAIGGGIGLGLDRGLGGTTLAGMGMVDLPLGPHLSVGGEVSLGLNVTGVQNERTSTQYVTFEATHRDTIYSGLLKVGPAGNDHVRASAAIGGGFAQRHTEHNSVPVTTGGVAATKPHEELSDAVWALTGGIDLAVRLSMHVSAVGLARLYQLLDDDRQPSGAVRSGVSSTIFRLGGGFQIRF
jgi:hypothetical protein